MTRGFVFGKFLPFHKGHQALIDFALGQCDELLVLVCSSDRESISGPQRVRWIKDTFSGVSRVDIRELAYLEEELPNTSISSRDVSQLWARKFVDVLPKMDLVVTSEKYGDHVAERMKIQHVPFDIDRNKVAISGTHFREDLVGSWAYLPDPVKRHFQKMVVFLGTECTAKSTISKNIARYFDGSHVPEAGREVIADSNAFLLSDLEKTAQLHVDLVRAAKAELKPVVILDTDIHITQSYSKFMFGEPLEVDPQIYRDQKADLYLYLDKDFPFEQDGTRLSKEVRDQLDQSHRDTLESFGVDFVEIKGNWKKRVIRSKALIDQLMREPVQWRMTQRKKI